MIPLTRALIVTWVAIWSTSRQDVALHLVTWVIIGSALASYFRDTWMQKIPFLVEVAEGASAEILDIMPESKGLLSLMSFAICGMTAFFLAGAESKSKGKSAMRGAWLVFAFSRVLFPISACGVDQNSDVAELLLFGLFSLLSVVGPLSSWPSRSFAISDAVYALVVNRTNQTMCTGTEAAVVAALLAFAHDAVHTAFLHFLEATAFAIATVFIAETTLMVIFVKEGSFEESWNDALNLFGAPSLEKYFFTKAPPVLLSAWAVGMFFRTFTQGRVSIVELLVSLAMGACFGLAVLVTARDPFKVASKPSFACVTLVTAMACASKLASGKKRALKKNKYIAASGFFAPVPVHAQQQPELLMMGREEVVLSTDSESDEEGEPAIEAAVAPRGVPIETQLSTSPSMNVTSRKQSDVSENIVDPKKVHADQLVREFEEEMRRQTQVQKRLFYWEALLKGLPSQNEKEEAKSEIAKLKTELEKCHTKTKELHSRIIEQEQ